LNEPFFSELEMFTYATQERELFLLIEGLQANEVLDVEISFIIRDGHLILSSFVESKPFRFFGLDHGIVQKLDHGETVEGDQILLVLLIDGAIFGIIDIRQKHAFRQIFRFVQGILPVFCLNNTILHEGFVSSQG